MILTLEMLKSKNACAEQVELFKQMFGDSVAITPELCVSIADKFDFTWAVRHLLSPGALAEYERVRAPALAEYRRIKESALAEYQRVRASALAEYERVTAPVWAEHERVRASAWAEYQRVDASAWDEYRRVYAPALAKYESVDASALAEYKRVRARAFGEMFCKETSIDVLQKGDFDMRLYNARMAFDRIVVEVLACVFGMCFMVALLAGFLWLVKTLWRAV